MGTPSNGPYVPPMTPEQAAAWRDVNWIMASLLLANATSQANAS
jgi:hypothetical protein